MSGATPTNPSGGGGFAQSANAFSGLTDTDLRPRARRKPLLTIASLLNRRKRRKGSTMLKDDVTGFVSTLEKSVRGIEASGAENRDELLAKTFDEFKQAVVGALEAEQPVEREQPLGEGLNTVQAFALALRDAGDCVDQVRAGRTEWMAKSGIAAEPISEEIADELDRWLTGGYLALRAMANHTAELPADEAELERAGQAGELHKVATSDGSELLVKTALPEELREFLTDGADMMSEYALLARSYTDSARALAEPLMKMDALPPELMAEFPELFVPEGAGQTGALGKADDENIGAGGDPDAAPDPGDLSGGDPLGIMQTLETITRMNSISVVLAGSLLQALGGDQAGGDQAGGDAGAPWADGGGAAVGKQEPVVAIEDVPLNKILAGEVAVSASVADALEEREALRKSVDHLTRQQKDAAEAMQKMQAVIDRMNAQPAAPKGAVFAMGKSDDNKFGGARRDEDEAARIAALADSDPERGSLELMKIVQSGGGKSLDPRE